MNYNCINNVEYKIKLNYKLSMGTEFGRVPRIPVAFPLWIASDSLWHKNCFARGSPDSCRSNKFQLCLWNSKSLLLIVLKFQTLDIYKYREIILFWYMFLVIFCKLVQLQRLLLHTSRIDSFWLMCQHSLHPILTSVNFPKKPTWLLFWIDFSLSFEQ